MKLAGVHLAVKTGMLAADALIGALASDDFSASKLGDYAEEYKRSWAYQEHWEARNFEGSADLSPLFAFLNIPIMLLTRGRGLIAKVPVHAPHTAMKRIWEIPRAERAKEEFEFDGVLTFSKEHLVGFSGTQHEADQPVHLKVADLDVCATACARDYGNPCESFCPAAVYEMVDDPDSPAGKKLFIHHENCVHCKTCDIADPYQIITWTPPEGGEGPDYTQM
jgi:electron-transferring-flavoprotein dehydrogenase